MKALFVNSQHPDAPHIGAVRAARFASGLAQRGHRVVLLTPVLCTQDEGTWPTVLAATLNEHDWAEPLLLTHPARLDEGLLFRRDSIPSTVRRALTATELAFGNGTYGERVAASRPFWRPLAREFVPDIVWSTFGDTSNLRVAQSIAQLADAAWIMDIKDNWEAFLPCVLRGVVAWRFRDAAGITSNSEFHARAAARTMRGPIATIYSGVAPEMIAAGDNPFPAAAFRIVLIGSMKGDRRIAAFLRELRGWLESRPPDERERVEFCYAGSAADIVADVAQSVSLPCRIDIRRYLSLRDLGALCKSAAANCYLWDPSTFHHKLLELLACGRPVIAYPGEHDESIELARRVGGSLSPCEDGAQLRAALEKAWRSWRDGASPAKAPDVSEFSWDASAVHLERLMLDIIAERRRKSRHRECGSLLGTDT